MGENPELLSFLAQHIGIKEFPVFFDRFVQVSALEMSKSKAVFQLVAFTTVRHSEGAERFLKSFLGQLDLALEQVKGRLVALIAPADAGLGQNIAHTRL